MKAWQVHHYGEPEEMTLDEVNTPSPGEGEVLIRNHAAGLNFFDILQTQGKYQSKLSFPFTIGGEVAGTIEAAGTGVGQWSPGDRVLCLTQGGGGYAEYSLGRAEAGTRNTLSARRSEPSRYPRGWASRRQPLSQLFIKHRYMP